MKAVLAPVWCFFILITLIVAVSGHGHDHGHGPSTSTTPNYWAQKTEVKKSTGVDVRWNHTDPDYLQMEVSSKTTGIVAIGFCPVWKGSMEGCDIVIGWVDDDTGKGYLYDYYSAANGAPKLDDSQDYELINANQDEAKTTIQFKRKWDTHDTDNDVVLKDTKVQLIYSWNPNDPKSKDDIPAHDKSTRGHTSVMVDLSKPRQGTTGSSSAALNLSTVLIMLFAVAAVCNPSSNVSF